MGKAKHLSTLGVAERTARDRQRHADLLALHEKWALLDERWDDVAPSTIASDTQEAT